MSHASYLSPFFNLQYIFLAHSIIFWANHCETCLFSTLIVTAIFFLFILYYSRSVVPLCYSLLRRFFIPLFNKMNQRKRFHFRIRSFHTTVPKYITGSPVVFDCLVTNCIFLRWKSEVIIRNDNKTVLHWTHFHTQFSRALGESYSCMFPPQKTKYIMKSEISWNKQAIFLNEELMYLKGEIDVSCKQNCSPCSTQ